MDPKLSILFLIVCGTACCSLQVASQKSNTTVSHSKRMLLRPSLHRTTTPPSQGQWTDYDYQTIPISDLGITIPPEDANDTVVSDHHIYYNSTFYSNPDDAKMFWIDFDELLHDHVFWHEELISYFFNLRRVIELTFEFPFYGYPLRNVTIGSQGYLHMGNYLNEWMASSQFAAPMMAGFDASKAVIKYVDNGTAFTVWWDKLYIYNRQDEGAFSFQVTLLNSGDIVFAYKDIPLSVANISKTYDPVTIGLSDAYMIKREYHERHILYEYNRINVSNYDISNNTAFYFTALKTCNTFKDCSSCLLLGTNLNCSWCVAVSRCSDGLDHDRQNWLESRCPSENVTNCPVIETSEKHGSSGSNVSPGAIATILVFLVAVVAVVAWVFYAYKHPQSSSGQFLIKHRPSSWATLKDRDNPSGNFRGF